MPCEVVDHARHGLPDEPMGRNNVAIGHHAAGAQIGIASGKECSIPPGDQSIIDLVSKWNRSVHGSRKRGRLLMTAEITDHDLTRAMDAGRQEADAEFRARSVRYIPDRDAIEIFTTRDVGFLIPRVWIEAFSGLTTNQLAQLEVWPDGSAIELDSLDIQVSVHGLLRQVLPAMLPASFLAGLFGSRGGKSTSSAKKFTARENGRKGGRPRKPVNPKVA